MKIEKILCVSGCLLLAFALSGCGCSHEYGAWEANAQVPCLAESVTKVCAKCGETETQSIVMPGHDFGPWQQVKGATCIAEGTEERICLRCGERELYTTKKRGHFYGEWKTLQNSTCLNVGTETRSCLECGKAETRPIDKGEHQYGTWAVTQEATCVSIGLQTRTCDLCGAEEESHTDFAAHTYGNWKIIVNPTCTIDGMQSRACLVCGLEEEAPAPAGHSWKDATCVAPMTCIACGAVEGTVAAHNWKSATCTEAKICTVCRRTEGSALGHAKNEKSKCSRCGIQIMIDMTTKVGKPNALWWWQDPILPRGVGEFKWEAENLSGKEVSSFSVRFYRNYDGELRAVAYKEIRRNVAPGGIFGYYENDLGIGSTGDRPLSGSDLVVGEITLNYSDGTIDTGWCGYTGNREVIPRPKSNS